MNQSIKIDICHVTTPPKRKEKKRKSILMINQNNTVPVGPRPAYSTVQYSTVLREVRSGLDQVR